MSYIERRMKEKRDEVELEEKNVKDRRDAEQRDRQIKRRVTTLVDIEIEKLRFNRGRYISKDYNAYLNRILERKQYPTARPADEVLPTFTDRFAALGAAMAEDIFDTMSRPSFMRMVLAPNDPSVVAYREMQEEIKGRVQAIMGTVSAYDRRGYYSDKGYVKPMTFDAQGLEQVLRNGRVVVLSRELAERVVDNPALLGDNFLYHGAPAQHEYVLGLFRGVALKINAYYDPDRLTVYDTARLFEFSVEGM